MLKLICLIQSVVIFLCLLAGVVNSFHVGLSGAGVVMVVLIIIQVKVVSILWDNKTPD